MLRFLIAGFACCANCVELRNVSCAQMSDSLSYVPAMPAIPMTAQPMGSGSLSPSASSFDMPTLHIGSTVALDREARVMRCAAQGSSMMLLQEVKILLVLQEQAVAPISGVGENLPRLVATVGLSKLLVCS